MKNSHICLVGVFPPPLHGMSLVTDYVRKRIAEFEAPCVINCSPGTLNRSFSIRFFKLIRVIGCGARFVSLLMGGRLHCVYVGLSGGYGQIYDTFFVGLSRLFGKKLYLHHHGYQYLDSARWVSKILMTVAGRKAVHIVACGKMACDLRRLYPVVLETRIISGIVALELGTGEACDRTEIRTIGFLSNISIEKGILEFLAVAERAKELHLPLRFVLAGPYQDDEIRALVEERMAALNNLKYIGPVYGSQKQVFFDSIDVFLFPSHNESEGLVIHEAMSRGVAVIAYTRGCIEQIISEHVGMRLCPTDDFASKTIDKIKEWSENPEAYQLVSQAAVRQFSQELEVHNNSFEVMCSEMLST